MLPIDLVPATRRPLLEAYARELGVMNQAVNLVARASAARIMEDHVEHCLTLAVREFPPGSRVVDWGSGGGLPAIPLAICFPQVEFVAVDSIAKKTNAVQILARRLALDNVTIWNGRAETWNRPINMAVSRATAPLRTLWSWSFRWLEPISAHATDMRSDAGEEPSVTTTTDKPSSAGEPVAYRGAIGDPAAHPGATAAWQTGLVCLKGGDLEQEIAELKNAYPACRVTATPLFGVFARDRWREKYILEVV